MIRTAYMAPSERAIKMLDVKRALLTYDRVLLPDPADRDLIPPQTFMVAMGMPPVLSINTGPVRPLGKVANYDTDFERLLDELSIARRQGLVDVVSTYDLSTSNQIIIGGIPTGSYPLNPRFMLWAFRSVARDQTVLQSAVFDDDFLHSSSDDVVSQISESWASADGAINDDAPLPMLDGRLRREDRRQDLSLIARGRVASTMKSIGYCASKSIVPVFSDSSYGRIANALASRAADVIDRVAQEDPYWVGRRKALEIAHDEYLNEPVLDSMSVDDVIRLRTTAWSSQARARDALLESVAELVRISSSPLSFEEEVRARIRDYRQSAEALIKQRSRLSFDITCEALTAGGGTMASLMAGSTVAGTLSNMQTAMGAGTVLLAGCLFAIDKLKTIKPASDQLRAAEEEFRDNVCFGLHSFYRNAGRAMGSGVRL